MSNIDKKIFSYFTLCLLSLLVARHSMFYLPLERIYTEFGYSQSIVGIFLIPVTCSFGLLFFFSRKITSLSNIEMLRYSLIGLLPIVINLIFSEKPFLESIWSTLTYSYNSASPRPSFLILVPIILSIYVSQWKYNLVVIILALSYVFLKSGAVGSDNFILYYMTIFVLFSRFSEKLHALSERYFYASGLSALLVYVSISVLIGKLHIDRIGLELELLFAVVFLYLIYFIVNLVLSIHTIGFRSLPRFNVFYFYISQAVFFNLVGSLNIAWDIIRVIVICCAIIFASICLSIFAYSIDRRIISNWR